MTTATEILQPVELDLEALLLDLRSLIGAGHPILQAAAEHLFSAGGKRLRPGIVLLISRALTSEKELPLKHRKLAQITEMIHTALLFMMMSLMKLILEEVLKLSIVDLILG